jgi:hypothetical protein
MNDSFQWATFDLGLDAWPDSRPAPHVEDLNILKNPPLPVDSFTTPLPVRSWAKLYSQAFWDHDFQKYGHQALKLIPDQPVPALLRRDYQRLKEYQRVFGRGEGQWLYIALGKIYETGKATLYIYLRQLVMERLEQIWIRKRWHHDSRTWTYRNKDLVALKQKCKDLEESFASNYRCMTATEEQKSEIIQSNNDDIANAIMNNQPVAGSMLDMVGYDAMTEKLTETSFYALLVGYQEIHEHVYWDLLRSQTMVLDYLKQTPDDRKQLYQRYGKFLYSYIEDTIDVVLNEAITWLSNLRDRWKQAGKLTNAAETEMQRVMTLLQMDSNHFATTKEYLKQDYVDIVDEGWRGKFVTIPAGRYGRRSRTLEKLAVREMTKCEEPIRSLIEKIAEIVDRHKDVFKPADADKEAQLIAKLEKNLEECRARMLNVGSAGLRVMSPGPGEKINWSGIALEATQPARQPKLPRLNTSSVTPGKIPLPRYHIYFRVLDSSTISISFIYAQCAKQGCRAIASLEQSLSEYPLRSYQCRNAITTTNSSQPKFINCFFTVRQHIHRLLSCSRVGSSNGNSCHFGVCSRCDTRIRPWR